MRSQDDQRSLSGRSSPVGEGEQEIVLRLHSVYRTTWERILVVLGSVEAEITYDSSGWGERVLVNGELAAQTSGFGVWSWKPVTVAPRVKFRLSSGGLWLPAQVEVSVHWAFWKGIKDFRLVVADRIVYEERAKHVVVPEISTTLVIRTWST
jgi:hypothetical protein